MNKNRACVSFMLVATLGLTACGGAGSNGANGGEGNDGELAEDTTFTLALATDPGSLDPHQTVLAATRGVNKFLYGQLVNLNEDGTAAPFLAEEWTADETTAEFTLSDDLTCSDGSPLTATQVAENIGYIADPENQSPLLGVFVMPETTATADDEAGTVTVTSGSPDAFLLRNIGTLPIACGEGLQDRSRLEEGQDGTGMYSITEIVANDHYTMTRREDATLPGGLAQDQAGLPAEVNVRIIPNETTSANLLLSGELNAAAISGPEQQRLDTQDLFRAESRAVQGEMFFNQAEGRPTQDEEVRRALVQALDLNAIGQVLTDGTGEPATGFVTAEPRTCEGDTVSGNLPETDPEAAAQALDEAGWTAGPDGTRTRDGEPLALTVIYPTQIGPTMAAGAELIQQTWTDLGASVTLQGVDSPGLNTTYFSTGEWDVSMSPLTLALPSTMVPFVSGPVPPDGTNFGHVENEEYLEAVERASGQAGEESCDDWNTAEEALITQVDALPYYNAVRPTFGADTEFRMVEGAIDPASIRMYQ